MANELPELLSKVAEAAKTLGLDYFVENTGYPDLSLIIRPNSPPQILDPTNHRVKYHFSDLILRVYIIDKAILYEGIQPFAQALHPHSNDRGLAFCFGDNRNNLDRLWQRGQYIDALNLTLYLFGVYSPGGRHRDISSPISAPMYCKCYGGNRLCTECTITLSTGEKAHVGDVEFFNGSAIRKITGVASVQCPSCNRQVSKSSLRFSSVSDKTGCTACTVIIDGLLYCQDEYIIGSGGAPVVPGLIFHCRVCGRSGEKVSMLCARVDCGKDEQNA